jgi:hypothetical protein
MLKTIQEIEYKYIAYGLLASLVGLYLLAKWKERK